MSEAARINYKTDERRKEDEYPAPEVEEGESAVNMGTGEEDKISMET